MDIKQIIGKNIEKIKEEFDLTNQELADIIGVSRQTISKYMNGDQIIDSAKLFILSKYFNIPMKYFMSPPDSLKYNNYSFMFRADNPGEIFNNKLRNKINKYFQNYLEIMDIYGENNLSYLPPSYKLQIKDNKIDDYTKELIREVADHVRKMLGHDDGTILDIYSLLEHNNIRLLSFSFDLKLDALSAFSEDKGAFIFINDHPEIPEERKRFSTIHELGHLIFHREDYHKEPELLIYKNSRKESNEKVANLFANYFLIPRSHLKEYRYMFKGFSDLETILGLKKKFYVSAEALLMALLEEKYIDSVNYGFLKKQLKIKGYEFGEPDPIKKIEKNEKYHFLLKRAYLEDKITINKLSEALDINQVNARKMVKEWLSDERKD